MGKFLRPKFWSQGTSLGSLRPLSQGDVLIGFHRLQFLVMWGPYNYPGIGASQAHAKTPKIFPRQCELVDHTPAIFYVSKQMFY